MSELQVSELQSNVFLIPEEISLFLGGSRGSGKTRCIPYLAFRHCMKYQAEAKVVIVRRQWQDLRQLMDDTLMIYTVLLGKKAGDYWNKAESTWRLPGGGVIRFTQVEDRADYSKWHGSSITLLIFDELPEWASMEVFDLMRTCLRAPKHVKTRLIVTGNPGGRSHSQVKARFVRWNGTNKYKTFVGYDSRLWCYVHALMADNPFLPPDYRMEIRAMRDRDPQLAEAWEHGNWDLALGAYFGTCLDRARNRTRRWDTDWEDRNAWELSAAYDHGTASPAALAILARAKDHARGGDGAFHHRGDICLIDEWTSALPDDANRGDGSTIPIVAEKVLQVLAKWGIPPVLISDDAVFANIGVTITIPDQFEESGIKLIPAKKGERIPGWDIMRTMMAAAKSNPGLREQASFYYAENCTYFEECAFAVEHDHNNREDLDTKQADHILDATRYGIVYILRPREYTTITPLPFSDPAAAKAAAARNAMTAKGRKKLRERGTTSVHRNPHGQIYCPGLMRR